MKCPDCDGSGRVLLPFERKTIPCRRCGTFGTISQKQAEWIEKGKALKEARLNDRIGMRDRAKQLGIPAAMLSDFERGILNPDSLPSVIGKPQP